MSNSQPRTSMSSRSNRDDVLQFLDSLDTYSGQPTPASAATTGLPRSSSNTSSLSHAHTHPSTAPATANGVGSTPKNAQEAQSVLDFLNEITASKVSSPPSAPLGRTSIDQPSLSTSTTTKRVPSTTMRTTTSRSNLSQIAASTPGATTTGTTPTRKSTESVRSQRSVTPAKAGLDRSSPSPATLSRTLPNSAHVQPSTSSVSATTPSAAALPSSQVQSPSQATSTAGGNGGGWGWSSVWSTASTAINQASQLAQQARTVAEEQVKANAGGLSEGLMKAWNHEDPNANSAGGTSNSTGETSGSGGGMKKWTEGVQGLVKNANLEGIGKELKSTTLKSLTDLLNAVAPPIAEHEVIQVSLSHSMKGYDGVETLVYRGLSKIMDQIEGGTLVVSRAKSDDPGTASVEDDRGNEEEERNLNLIEGIEAGWKLSQETLDKLISSTYKPSQDKQPGSPSSLTLPVTNCPVYLRLQPVLSPLPSLPSLSSSSSGDTSSPAKQLYFLLLLIDPTHSLTHHTVSQPLPASWLDIPFEENEWVEEFMVEAIRGATEVIGQEYITGRMRAQGVAIEQAKEEARKTIDREQSQRHEEQGGKGKESQGGEEQEREVSTMAQEARVGIV